MASRDEILSDKLLLDIKEVLDPAVTPVADFSVYLGFGVPTGNSATITGLNSLNLQSSYGSLLQKYKNIHGTGKESALKLRIIFREHNMAPAAEILETELRRRKIEWNDVEVDPDLPAPPSKAW